MRTVTKDLKGDIMFEGTIPASSNKND